MTEAQSTRRDGLEAEVLRVFEEQIAPQLEELEGARRRALSKLRRDFLILALVAGAALAPLLLFAPGQEAVVFVVLIAVFVAGIRALFLHHQFSDGLKDRVIGPICRAFGNLTYSRDQAEAIDLRSFSELGLLPGFSGSELEDLFQGRHREVVFRMAEVALESGRRFRTKIFKGLLFNITVPGRVSGRTLIAGDLGILGNPLADFLKKTFSGMERVAFDHAAFEAAFQVYSDVPEEARRLMPAPFLDTMLALTPQVHNGILTAGFADGRFLLALPRDEAFFEVGGLLDPMDRLEDRVKDLIREITIAHRLIDYLHGERPGPLV